MSKLPLKDILAAVDMGAKEIWDQLSDDEKKQVSFYLLNRYVSSVKGSRDKQELAVFKTNEYYNKQFSFAETQKATLATIMFGWKHKEYPNEWIGHKRKFETTQRLQNY